MKSKFFTLSIIILLISFTKTYSQSFNKNTDLLLANFDLLPDDDDVQASAALACMLKHSDFDGVNYYAVAGAYGTQTDRFTFIDTTVPDYFNTLFGSENVNWTNADNNWDASVNRVTDKVVDILNNGGKVWVQEGGQSDFTYDVAQAAMDDGISLATIGNSLIVVQHSGWNQNNSTSSKLDWLRDNADYRKIADGNSGGNGSAEYKSSDTKWMDQALSSNNEDARTFWTMAKEISDNWTEYNNPTIRDGGVDFSDCVENWEIFDLGANLDDVDSFWSRYVTNETDGGGSIENENPVVGIDSPVNGSSYDESEGIRFIATATDDGAISNVKFYANGILLATENSAPYDVTKSIAEAGSYQITAIATDNEGATTTSSVVTITVSEEGEIPTPPTGDGNLVHITKRNATGFAIDGGAGGTNRQNVTLSTANTSDEGQLWLEIDRGNGYYSYEKFGTNYSLDGDGGGAANQSVYLYKTNATNQNQQWQKVAMGDGGYKLIKRNATGFAINGGSGGKEGQDINLWNSGSASHNLQWYITPVGTAETTRLEAEDFDSMSGIQTEASSESGDNVGWINDGDWLRFDDVNLSGISNMDARVSSRFTGGTIEVRIGGASGTLIGSINVSNTGGDQNWTTLNTSISNASGTQDVYLVFTGGNGYLYNVNWVEFNTSSQSNKDIIASAEVTDVIIYPNPVISTTTIKNAANSTLNVYDINGSIVFKKLISSDSELIDLSVLTTGIYYTEINGSNTTSVVKLVKN